MNTCGTCKYRGENIICMDSSNDYKDKETSYFVCDRVQFAHRWQPVDVHKPGHKALVQDGSGYYAALCVEDDFGCVLWEGKA